MLKIVDWGTTFLDFYPHELLLVHTNETLPCQNQRWFKVPIFHVIHRVKMICFVFTSHVSHKETNISRLFTTEIGLFVPPSGIAQHCYTKQGAIYDLKSK